MKTLSALFALFLCLLVTAPARAAESASECMAQCDGILHHTVEPMWDQDDEYFHHGDYPRIVALDRIITQVDPHFVECYATGGWLMESLGRYKDAEAFYQEGVRNNAKAASIYYSLGMFYYNTLHDYNAAVAVYQMDVARAPNADVNDWKMLAHSYERQHNMSKALSTWKEIAARWPNGPAVQSNLHRVLEQQGLSSDAAVPKAP